MQIMSSDFDVSKVTKHIYAIELSNEQRLEVSELLVNLREQGIIPSNENMGRFMYKCFFRGFYEYKEELLSMDEMIGK
jgi:hypothetical protein